MKLTTFLLVIGCLHLSANGDAQTITYSGTNISLKKAFDVIKTQTGLAIFVNDDILKGSTSFDLDLKEATVEQALTACLSPQKISLEFWIAGRTIVVKEKEVGKPQIVDSAAPGPKVKVRGIVYNDGGEPLSGANVVIKELEKGTITNAKGVFDLGSVQINSTVIISYIGYSFQQIKAKDDANLKIYLKVARNELDKVVIQAYGTTTQRLATGDISTVTAEQISRQPVMNALEAIQGEVPGAVVTNTTGYASGTIKVEIRGRSSINSNFPSDPLYIVDGVPLTILDVTGNSSYSTGGPGFIQSGLLSDAGAGGGGTGSQSPLFSINPSDIESIQVLKDADATAIYGSRGANGVVLITTKKGKAGNTHLDLEAYQGASVIARKYPLMNTPEYIAMRQEALRNDGLPLNINTAPDLVLGSSTRYTDWQKYIWGRTGQITDVNASLSGGDAATTFRLSAGYHYQRDLTSVSGGNGRGSLALNFKHKTLGNRLTLTLSTLYSFAETNQISVPGAPNMAPNAPAVFDKLGNLNFAGWDAFYGGNQTTPFGNLLQPYVAATNFLTSNFLLNYELLKGLSIRASLGYNNAQSKQSNEVPIASQDPVSNPKGQSIIGNSIVHNIILEPQLEYSRYLNKGKLDVLAGATDQANVTTGLSLAGNGITNDALLNLVASAPVRGDSYYSGEYKYAALFGRVNYNWEDKYILNLNGRRDGSSRFGPGRQYGNFGSVGMAYVFTEEKWMKDHVGFLSFGKLRGSYGLTGSDNILDYQYLTQWVFGNYQYNSVSPLTPIKHTDSLYHWQVSKKLELGVELGFLQDRITVSASWYRARCNDQLVPFPMPDFTGFSSVTTNTPADVQNTGWEFLLNAKIVESKNFRLNVKANLAINKNKLLYYPNISQSPYAASLVVGQPLNIRRVLHNTGVDPLTGLYTFQDKNKDGQITYDPGSPTDDSYVYNLNVRFDGGVTLEAGYKRWDVSVLFYYRDQPGYSAFTTLDIPGDFTNQPTELINNVWQKPGDKAKYARYTTNPGDPSYNNFQSSSDGVLTDASFIRLQNLQVSYTLKGKGSIGFDVVRIFIRGQNLFLITKYKGADPEIQSMVGLPLPRMATGGFSVNF